MSTLRKPILVGLAILLAVLAVAVMKSGGSRKWAVGREQGKVGTEQQSPPSRLWTGGGGGAENEALVKTGIPPVAVTQDPTEELTSLVRRRASLHPSEAAAWVQALPEGQAKTTLLQDVAIVWAEKDPLAALEWANGLPAGEGRQVAVCAIGYEAARGEPTNALMAALALESGPGRNQLILHVINQWAVTDPVTALNWVETVQESGLRDELFANLATAWAKQNGEVAAMLASSTVRAEATKQRAVVSVVQRWAHTNPGAAREWVERLPDASLRSNCWESLPPSSSN